MTFLATRRIALGAILVAGFALAGPAQAAPVSFTVDLTGAAQVPPVQTSGHGKADLTYDAAKRIVTWSITFENLSSAPTMAHFHGPAAAGQNASVTVWLTKKGGAVTSPIKGEATLTPEQASQFAAGQWYINVHTKDHPAGEIRGQVTPPKG
ncbi:MAG TPA: CHRD domain-containing protein [Roseiarcus sp.]|nr:CHRD domain-containing protein [Roseiarcus sp.]